MGAWKRFLQRWSLRSAIRQGKKAGKPPKSGKEKEGILFIFPPEPALAKTLVAPVREWLLDYQGGPVIAVVPQRAVELTKRMKPAITVIPYSTEDQTRSGLPQRELRRRVASKRVRIAFLLTEDVDPFTETIFALAQARTKAAMLAPGREEYVDLLLRPNEANAPAKKVLLLLRALTTFGSNLPTVDPGSVTARLAAETFSTPPEENGTSETPFELPSRRGEE